MLRNYTSDLSTTGSSDVLDWLKAAMDLHYKDRISNPLWNDGKTLRAMWEATLAKDLPSGDRCANEVPDMKIRNNRSLHATDSLWTHLDRDEFTPRASISVERPHTHSVDGDILHTTPTYTEWPRTAK